MRKIKIGFIVLHYIGLEDTVKCIESIFATVDTEAFEIVVVDNCSPNDSFDKLQTMYDGKEKVTLLKSETNVGFARGNNIGYRYLKNNFDVDFIIMLNNDVVLFQRNMVELIEKEYDSSSFSVLGPMILSANGRCNFNPMRLTPWTCEQAERYIKGKKALRFFNRLGLGNVFQIIRSLRIRKKHGNKNFLDRAEDVELFGCFLIFSRQFIRDFDGLDERTFLFAEEDILYTQMHYSNHLMVYTPEIAIYHNEDSSVRAITGGSRSKTEFMVKHILDSMEVLKTVIKECTMK